MMVLIWLPSPALATSGRSIAGEPFERIASLSFESFSAVTAFRTSGQVESLWYGPLMTLVPRVSLALSGLMVSLPFLNFHHSLPLPTFYTEWTAFALGTAALLALAFAPTGQETRIPVLSLGLIGFTLVLLIQVAAGGVAYSERSFLGMLYVLWAALLVWLGAHLREHCGLERVALVLQVFTAFGGFLVAITGFILYYQIDWAGFRLISGVGMDGMYGAIGQRNNFANYLGCALASVVFLFGRRLLSLPLATLLAVPLEIGRASCRERV